MKPGRAESSIEPRFRIYAGKDIALGPGKIELLRHIEETGSIAEAARKMEMSYNRAWLLLRTMNRCFKKPLVTPARGGNTRGGTGITPTGKAVLALYNRLEAEALTATREIRDEIRGYLKR